LCDDRLEQAHVFSSSNRQSIEAKVSNHLRNGFERATELAKDVLAGVVLSLDSHVHEAFGAPGRKSEILIKQLTFREAN
jgi:hypothetical protein